MGQKKVVLLISSSPFSTLNNYEALRSAIALYDHEVSIIWHEDGVYCTLRSVDNTRIQSFLRLTGDLDIKLFVSGADLKERGIDEAEVMLKVAVICKAGLIEALGKAQVVLNF